MESEDTLVGTEPLVQEIQKMAHDVGRSDIILLPFAHLSNELAESELSLLILDNLTKTFSKEFNVRRGHFGSHKEFLVDVFGHAGNVRFREY